MKIEQTNVTLNIDDTNPFGGSEPNILDIKDVEEKLKQFEEETRLIEIEKKKIEEANQQLFEEDRKRKEDEDNRRIAKEERKMKIEEEERKRLEEKKMKRKKRKRGKLRKQQRNRGRMRLNHLVHLLRSLLQVWLLMMMIKII